MRPRSRLFGPTALMTTGMLFAAACTSLEDPWAPRVVPSPEPVELLDEPALAIVAGGNHSCAQTGEDTLVCWGNLIVGASSWTVTPSPQPVAVTGPIVALAAGEDLTCTLASTGTVECWGAGTRGALGVESTAVTTEPVVLEALADQVAAVSVGYRHACARLVDGSVACWGDNALGQVGLAEEVRGTEDIGPQVVLESAEQVVAGPFHTCASVAEQVTCWGSNVLGAVSPAAGRSDHAWADVSVSAPVLDLALGAVFTCALEVGGAVECWGEGLGYEDAAELRVVDLGDVVATRIVAGATHVCVLDEAGVAWCWGDDGYGQVGDGGEAERFIAAPVGLDGGPYVDLSAGLAHTCGLTEDGVVECWGANQVRAAGQTELGDA